MQCLSLKNFENVFQWKLTFIEVKIRDPGSVWGSIPEFNKWSSGINPRTSKMAFWEWSQNVFIFFWDLSQSQKTGFLGLILEPQKNCSGSNWIEYLSISQNIILWALGFNRVFFWDQSQNKFLGSVPEKVSGINPRACKKGSSSPCGGLLGWRLCFDLT